MATGSINQVATAQQAAASDRMAREPYGLSVSKRASAAQGEAIIKMIKDTNDDGKVSKAEEKAYAAQLDKFRTEIDRNGDGQLSFAEQVDFAVKQKTLKTSEVSRLLAVDTNKDGVMTRAEVAAYELKKDSLNRAAQRIADILGG